MSKVEIVATGERFLGKGLRGIDPVLESMIMGASSEIILVTYLIKESAIHILELIENAAMRGVKVKIILNNYSKLQTGIRQLLVHLKKKYDHVSVFTFTKTAGKALHAKVVIVDRKFLFVGSANITWGGMYSNHEVGVLIEGDPAWKMASIIDDFSLDLKRI